MSLAMIGPPPKTRAFVFQPAAVVHADLEVVHLLAGEPAHEGQEGRAAGVDSVEVGPELPALGSEQGLDRLGAPPRRPGVGDELGAPRPGGLVELQDELVLEVIVVVGVAALDPAEPEGLVLGREERQDVAAVGIAGARRRKRRSDRPHPAGKLGEDRCARRVVDDDELEFVHVLDFVELIREQKLVAAVDGLEIVEADPIGPLEPGQTDPP